MKHSAAERGQVVRAAAARRREGAAAGTGDPPRDDAVQQRGAAEDFNGFARGARAAGKRAVDQGRRHGEPCVRRPCPRAVAAQEAVGHRKRARAGHVVLRARVPPLYFGVGDGARRAGGAVPGKTAARERHVGARGDRRPRAHPDVPFEDAVPYDGV